MLIDIHTHKCTEASQSAIRNLTFAEAESILISGVSGCFSIGIHPWDIDATSNEKIIQLETWLADRRMLAIGECGLDKYSKASLKLQAEFFEKQIYLSEQLQKPMIIHCVGRFNELFELKRRLNPQQLWIIHGFRGKPELAEQVLKTGCALSYGEYFNPESVNITPIEKLFVETDESHTSIEEIYSKISNIKNCKPQELIAGELFFEKFLLK